MNINSSACFSQEIIVENPEELGTKNAHCHQQQLRCRICYETSKPLVSICACTGSIQYVHEQCILDWIAKKLQVSDVLDIPRCQICHERFSARMKIGKKKLCLSLLWQKIKSMRQQEILLTLFHISMFIFCLFTIFLSLDSVLSTENHAGSQIANTTSTKNSINNKQHKTSDIVQVVITNFMCPIYGVIYFLSYIKSKQRWIEESMVQVVEVVLQPKIVRKY